MIETTLNRQQAEALFAQESFPVRTVSHMVANVVPMYRIIELFGVDVGKWAEENIGLHPETREPGCLSGSTPFSVDRDSGEIMHYTTSDGFFFIVAEHNLRTATRQALERESGRQWATIWEARCKRLEAADAEEERKQEERRAKRAAARKAKQEAQQAIKTTAEPA